MRTRTRAERKQRASVLAVLFAAGLAVGGVVSIMSDLKPGEIGETYAPVSWEEDELPAEMYAWVEDFGVYPETNLVRLSHEDSRARHGRINCWEAVAETTLVMCPDGYVSTS